MCHSANKDINNAPFPYKRSGTIFFIMPWSKHIALLGRYEKKQYTKYCPSSFVWERCMMRVRGEARREGSVEGRGGGEERREKKKVVFSVYSFSLSYPFSLSYSFCLFYFIFVFCFCFLF
jgi:hypothetical protein